MVYLVRDRPSLLRAVRLFTHVWGGRSNVILPLPVTDDDVSQAISAISNFDPDFIILDDGDENAPVFERLESLPCMKRRLRPSEIDEFINGINPLMLGSGQAADPYFVLQREYPAGLQTSRIRMIEPDGPFDFVTRIVWGDPSENVAGWLQNTFAAKMLRAPKNADDLVRSSIVGSQRVKPIDISDTSTAPHLSYRAFDGLVDPLRGPLIQNAHAFFIFLDVSHGLAATCTYWNTRAADGSNKLLLPLDPFKQTLREVVQTVSATRRVDHWIIVADIDETSASAFLTDIREAVGGDDSSGDLAIISSGFKYSIPPFRTLSGLPTAMTVQVGDDNDIRFVVPRPRTSQGTLFGFDAEVQRDGNKLSLPTTTESALLLSNSAERLRRFESNDSGLGRMWLRIGLPVRPRVDGIAAVTTPEDEFIWYLPTPEMVIRQTLRSRGFSISPNRHTRYAVGVANRLGGLGAAMNFSRAGGFVSLKPLLSQKAAQSGLQSQQIEHLLQTEHGLTRESAKKALSVDFPRLLETGLVRRGFALTCSHCDLTEWYEVSNLREFVECAGCGQPFQLRGLRLDFYYRINELAARMVREGGLAVMSTAAALTAMGGQNIQLGGDLSAIVPASYSAEIDVICANREALTVAECKDYEDITIPKYLEQLSESIDALIQVAKDLKAQIVVLGVLSRRWNKELFAKAVEAATRTAEFGAGFHLLLNGDLHLSGGGIAIDPSRLTLRNLLPLSGEHRTLGVAGALPKAFGGGRSASAIMTKTVDTWEFELLLNPRLVDGS
jgi:hypothetical protein